MWIHKHSQWPAFTFDANRLIAKLADVRHRQGRLLGKMENLGFEFKREACLATLIQEAVQSAAIEGETLPSDEVHSSIAYRLGMDVANPVPASREVEGMVDMVLDATQRCSQPLTKERICSWHAALFPTGRSSRYPITVGDWRPKKAGPMRVVSGPRGREKIHFEAPSANRLEKEMAKFLKWFEQPTSLDPVLKAGIAHLWFVTIHPFEDGNGRIGRALADLVLARADRLPNRFYSVSAQIKVERKNYYRQLEQQQRSAPEITDWLEWYVDCFGRAVDHAQSTLAQPVSKAQFWGYVNQYRINERQKKVVKDMWDKDMWGKELKKSMSTSKYAKWAGCSTDTALRDIQKLKDWGILAQNLSGGRSTNYRLKKTFFK